MSSLLVTLQNALKNKGTKKIADGKNQYFKNVIEHRGCTSPTITEIFSTHKAQLKALPIAQSFDMALDLMKSKYSEDKQLGILILNANVKQLQKSHFDAFVPIIDSHIYDWGTCDSFSGKVLHDMIKNDKKLVKHIIQWKDSSYLWRQRASCITFVKLARHGQHNKEIIDICTTCVKSKERFVQLGVGWVLRELSLADHALVVGFIQSNYSLFSREGLRYAIEKMSNQEKSRLLKYSPESTDEDESEHEEAGEEEKEEKDEQEEDEGTDEDEKTQKGKRRTSKRRAATKRVKKM